jgi:hypothetical protein
MQRPTQLEVCQLKKVAMKADATMLACIELDSSSRLKEK